MIEVVLREETETMTAVKVTAEGRSRVEELTAAGKCLGCERETATDETVRCGLCNACYQGALNAIARGKTDRKALIRHGKMLPPTKGGRKPANKFTQELAEL